MTGLPELRTSRLLLRGLEPAHAADVERFAGTWEVASTTLNIPHPYPAGGGAQWIATHADGWARGEHLTLGIFLHSAPQALLGAVGLHISRSHQHAELGYWIAHHAWGKGYATEASLAIMSYGFETLGMHRILGRHFTRNPASGRVMQKLGMQFEGVNRHAYLRWGQFEDVAMYARLSTDRQT